MTVSVRCPGCEIACAVPPELLGRTGRCNQCGRRIRLAAPTAELLGEAETPTAAYLPTVEESDEPVSLDTAPAPAPDDPPRPARPAAPKPGARRGPSVAVLAVLALVGLAGGSATGALLVKYLVPAERPAPEPIAATTDPPAPLPPNPLPPEPKPPEPKPQPPEPKPPEPKPPEPKPPEPKPPEPAPAAAGPKRLVKLPAPAVAMTAGAGGRFLVFQAAGQAIVYDAQLDRTAWTIRANPDDLVAATRTKLFFGRVKDAHLARFDLTTGAREAFATKGAAATLRFLAAGPASDGPLVVVARTAADAYHVRLLDPNTLAELSAPIDGDAAGARGFPFVEPVGPLSASVSADGRVVVLGNRYFARADDRYKAAVLPVPASAQHLPAPDGRAFVGTKLFAADGEPLPGAELPPGTLRRYVPAAAGTFVVSAEYKVLDPSVVKLALHLGTDPKPLGPLPGGEEVAAWAKAERAWVGKLHQHLVFVPEPPLLVFCPPGAESAQVFPIDLPALLAAGGQNLAFTSTPAAEFEPGRPYAYRATAAAVVGPVAFALEAGPPGLTVARGGALSWPQPPEGRAGHEVRIAATDARGNKVVQTFRLVPARRDAPAPKKPPEVPDPKKEPEEPKEGGG